MCIEFKIIGEPTAKGRPRFTKTGHAYTPEKTRKNKRDIILQARQYAPQKPPTGALRCDREYIFTPPKKPKHPTWHIVRPDLDNLDKALWDAFNGIFFVDDCQICAGVHSKRYALPGEEPGIVVKLRKL